MLRRLLLGTVIAAFCVSSGGCYFAQVFFYHLYGEGHVPVGELTCISCTRFQITPFELVAGEWQFTGKLQPASGDKLPRKVIVQFMAKDENEKMVGRQTMAVKVAKDGTLSGTKKLKKLVVPLGGYFCVYLKPKGNDINAGAIATNISLQNNDKLSSRAAAPGDG